MTVKTDRVAEGENGGSADGVKMKNNIILSVISILVWALIVVMNVALLVLLGMGKAS